MNVNESILSFLTLPHPLLDDIERQLEHIEGANPEIGPEVGKLLYLLVRMLDAKRVLELGTSLGYSAVWLGSALRATSGRLTSIEIKENFVQLARENMIAADLAETVDIVQADSADWLAQAEGPFDLILQDGLKAQYPETLARLIELTRVGGVIVADDSLFVPMGVAEKHAVPIHRYNELAFADPRLQSTILPIGDGVTVSLKIAD